MKKKVVKKTVLKEEELTKIVGGSTARVGFNFLNKSFGIIYGRGSLSRFP